MKAQLTNAAPPRFAQAQPLEEYFTAAQPERFGLEEIKHVLVVSDLHLGEGQLPDSAYWDRLENFTCDAEFEEFLQYEQDDDKRATLRPDSMRERGWSSGILPTEKLLVLNGDFIDFLRIMRTPRTKRAEHAANAEEDWSKWKTWLDDLQDVASAPKLNEAKDNLKAFQEDWTRYALEHRWWHYLLLPFSKRLRAIRRQGHYGLDAEDFKSIYRLGVAAEGHEKVFEALRVWLNNGSAIAILSGNHDQEMDQELVQAWFRHELGAVDDLAKRLQFFPQGLELCEQIRLEHGHRFEWHTRTEALARDRKSQPVTPPPGSFFNRFFVNKIETVAPYLDNVRPITRVVAYLFRSHTPEALGLLGQGLKAALRLLFSRNAKALRFLGYSFLALCNGLLSGFNVALWIVLLLLANGRALVTHLLVLVSALALTGVAVWAWNQITQQAKALVTRLLRKPNSSPERRKPSKYVWRRLAFFAIVLTVFVWPLVDAILWWRAERETLSRQILFQNWPVAESLARDFFMWLLRGLRNSFQTLLLFFAPLLKITLAAWGLRLLREGLRPHFNLAEVRAKMTEGWNAPAPRFITCGHTHIPDKRMRENEGLTYLNSGTWNLVFEYQSDVVRDDLSKTFVEFLLRNNKWEGELWRWEPPKIRENQVVLLEPRNAKMDDEQIGLLVAA